MLTVIRKIVKTQSVITPKSKLKHKVREGWAEASKKIANTEMKKVNKKPTQPSKFLRIVVLPAVI